MGSKKKAGKRKRLKPCPGCKGTKICGVCKGCGVVQYVHGRNKGSTFERAIAKQVSGWTGVHFTRTPSSGGWNKTGDITPKDPKAMVAFPFNIECKNQEIFSSTMLVSCAGIKLTKTIAKWWKQCTDDSKKSKRIPLLIMSCAREPVFVMMHKEMFVKLRLIKKATFSMKIKSKKGGHLRVMLWSDFLKIDYSAVALRLERKNKKAIKVGGKHHG